jgi:hypothetical protein
MIAHIPSDRFFHWSDEAIAMLRKLHGRGDSSRVIADALARHFKVSLTRNAVIGKRMRMGMTRSEEFKAAAIAGQNKRCAAQKRAEAERQQKIAERAAARLAMQRAADEERQQKSGKPKEGNVIVLNTRVHPDVYALAPKVMMDPGFCGCRWPLERTAENGEMLFCCNATPDPLDTYCPDHKRRAYQRTRTPAQIAADEAHREARIIRARAMGLKQGPRNANAWGVAR